MTAKSNSISAKSLAREIAAKRMTPNEALSLGKANTEAMEKKLHVFAHQPEQLVAQKGPLTGIAVGVKDIFDTFDMPTRSGSKIYLDNQPLADASLVSMLRNAGATIAGKTVTTEFAWFTPGPTRNPHNSAHTPGGSSSGSAAGVAAGFFPAAIGSQTGGSIIRPAAFCGVAGYKPSFRLFPTVGMKHFSWSLDTAGFFAASVADAAFVAAACSGRRLDVDENLTTPPSIGVLKSSIDGLMDEDMAKAFTRLGRRARTAGAQVTSVRSPKIVENARAAHGVIQDFEANLALGDEQTRHPRLLSKPLREYLKAAHSVTPDQYDDARRIANRARKASHDLFENCDVLLLASAPGTAPRSLKSTGDSSFNRLLTLLGMPCVNVPGLFAENGLPLGVQIVAPFGKDQRALQAAHWLESIIRAD